MTIQDKKWLKAMLSDRENNRTLYDALADENLPANED